MSIWLRIRWQFIKTAARISPPCCRIAHQISDGRQKPLTWRERFTVRTHLMICDWCTSYSKQLEIMSDAGRLEAAAVENGSSLPLRLSDSARDRLRRALEEEN